MGDFQGANTSLQSARTMVLYIHLSCIPTLLHSAKIICKMCNHVIYMYTTPSIILWTLVVLISSFIEFMRSETVHCRHGGSIESVQILWKFMLMMSTVTGHTIIRHWFGNIGRPVHFDIYI